MRHVRVGWRDLAEGLGVRYVKCPSDEDVLSAARERARGWADCFENTINEPLTLDEREALAVEAEEIMRCHWSSGTVLPALLDVHSIVEATNSLCRRDPPSGRVFVSGDGLSSWSKDGVGIRFAIAPPIVLGYEVARINAGLDDDGAQVHNIGSQELLFLMSRVCGPVEIDLGGWEDELDDPVPNDVVRFVSRRRSRLRISGQKARAGA